MKNNGARKEKQRGKERKTTGQGKKNNGTRQKKRRDKAGKTTEKEDEIG